MSVMDSCNKNIRFGTVGVSPGGSVAFRLSGNSENITLNRKAFVSLAALRAKGYLEVCGCSNTTPGKLRQAIMKRFRNWSKTVPPARTPLIIALSTLSKAISSKCPRDAS
jgi:hypothetical protein